MTDLAYRVMGAKGSRTGPVTLPGARLHRTWIQIAAGGSSALAGKVIFGKKPLAEVSAAFFSCQLTDALCRNFRTATRDSAGRSPPPFFQTWQTSSHGPVF